MRSVVLLPFIFTEMKKVIQERLQEYGLTTYEKLEASSEVDSVLNEIKCMGGKDFCHVIEVFFIFPFA